MSLRLSVVFALWLVTATVGVVAIVWTAAEAYRTAEIDTRTTFARAGEVLERNYKMAPEAGDASYAGRTSLSLLSVMAPGTCITFEQTEIVERRLCSGWRVFGSLPPDWFRVLVGRVFSLPQPLSRAGTASQARSFTLETGFDPVAAATLAWKQVRLALLQTIAMSLAILVLGTLAVLHPLRPVRNIVGGIDRIAEGDLSARVVPSGVDEFRRIGSALNRLAGQLQDGAARRQALTRKLLEVEDAERRQLARDLHDEFGQTLTATNALAASIALTAGSERPDIVRDARAIGANIRGMMETLRGAFARLRPPDLEDMGLAASLRTMLSGWAVQRRTRLSVSCDVDTKALPHSIALDLYRIVQECVTNAMRHGSPETVEVELARDVRGLLIRIEDDGGGSLPEERIGQGLLGIRDRVAAIGGELSLTTTSRGVRVAVVVPLEGEARVA